ncbi:MAG: hypothetical protein ABJF10_00675 [Chthoniobacter sp.]|uniref:hypothetical protein n=1 Tax=Chthoniobacter sp. TaxID=2510640 RepID=UPI0032A8ED82
MPAPDSPTPEAPLRRRPICTIASWVLPALGALLTFIAYQIAYARRSNGDWFPGMGQLVIGIVVTGFGTFGFGLAALLRRERNRWVALLPFLCGLGVVLDFSWFLLRRWWESR